MKLSYFIFSKFQKKENNVSSTFIVKLAVVSVALSISIMLLTNALVLGFKNQIKSKVFDFWGHIQLYAPNYDLTSEPKPIHLNISTQDSILNLMPVKYEKDISFLGINLGTHEFKTKGGIKAMQSFVQVPGIISSKNILEGILLKGVFSNFNTNFFKNYIVSGTQNFLTTNNGRNIILSETTSERLSLKVGDSLVVNFVKNGQQVGKKFFISSIYKTGLEEYDKKIAIVDASTLQQFLGWRNDDVSGYEIFVDQLADLPVINDYLYNEIIPNDVYSNSIQSRFPSIFEWLQLQDYNEVIILSLMVLVCLINMATVLIIFVINRLSMIGILKTLGMKNKAISHIFLFQAGKIILLGCIWGNIIGLGLAFLQKKFSIITLDEKNYYLSVAPIELSWHRILLIDFGVISLILIFLLIPSCLVYKISPSKTITFN